MGIKSKPIIGKIIGNIGREKIKVMGIDQEVYILDRFALIRQLFDDTCLFELPMDYDRSREILNEKIKKKDTSWSLY